MKVTFCGHAQIGKPEEIRCQLRSMTEYVLENGAETFYFGGYGAFDHLAACTLQEYKPDYPEVERILVLAYLEQGQDYNTLLYDGTVYPPLESVPPRFAILKRNQWMVEQSDVVIAYVTNGCGGAAKTLQYARRKGKQILQVQDGSGE